ncbi:MAG: hypothetical protein HRT47_02355 [Candidatus Caenarcaniphilales bacterium]|nr:hypothetical protein [Candidatus Caenarcaniphilales bacterium]
MDLEDILIKVKFFKALSRINFKVYKITQSIFYLVDSKVSKNNGQRYIGFSPKQIYFPQKIDAIFDVIC